MLVTSETEEPQKQSNEGELVQRASSHKKRVWRSTFIQFAQYCIVGGLNTLVDVGMLNILLWRFPTHNGELLATYNAIAYSSGAISSFLLNKYWTFRHTHKPTVGELVRYVMTIVIEVLYSSALIWVAGRALQPFIANITIWGNAAKLVAVVCGAMLSYPLMRFWTFAHGSKREKRAEHL